METKKTVKERRKHDADFKAQVLEMLACGQSAVRISEKPGMGENLVYHWKKEAGGRKMQENMPKDALLERIESLRKERKPSGMFWKKRRLFFQSTPEGKIQPSSRMEPGFRGGSPVPGFGCEQEWVLPPSQRRNIQLPAAKEKKQRALRIAFRGHKSRYGSRRLRSELADENVELGRHQVGKTMRRMHLKASRCTHVAGSLSFPAPHKADMENAIRPTCFRDRLCPIA